MAGFSDAEILRLCNRQGFKGFKAPPYWTAEVYGFGKWIREYCNYPWYLPLCIYTDHGPPMSDTPSKQELESGAPYLFFHSLALAKKWKEITKKEGFVLYSPFVYYRRKKNLHRSPNARGTLAFPAHTNINIEDQSDVGTYIKQLLKLPRKFQPVSVCLFYDDIKKGKHRIFQKYKIPIYTAGYYYNDRFTERFYDILKNFKYATSNKVGSYLYYAVEMGLPFSIYGQKQKYINKGDPNLSAGEYDSYKLSALYRRIHRMFNGLHTKISPEQKRFVEINLGLRDGISPPQMRNILYKSLFQWVFSSRPIMWFFKIAWVVIQSALLKIRGLFGDQLH